MKFFFHLSIFVAYVHFIVASFHMEVQFYTVAGKSEEESQAPQDYVVEREPEELQYDAAEKELEEPQHYNAAITLAYHEYLANANEDTYYVFRNKACEYFIQFPFECLELLVQFQDDCTFKLVFWSAIGGDDRYLDLSGIPPISQYPKVVGWIIKAIKRILSDCCRVSISKFKTDLEIVSRLITEADWTIHDLKSYGFTSIEDLNLDLSCIDTRKFLAKEIATDFATEKIHHLSLFLTFVEVIGIIESDLHSNTTTFNLPKQCALLQIYLYHIYANHCTSVFDADFKYKAVVIYLAMKLSRLAQGPGVGLEHFSYFLGLHLQELFETKSLRFDPIANFLKKKRYDPRYYRYLLGKASNLSLSELAEATNFSELSKLLNDDFNQAHPKESWEIRALAELELFVSQNGLKVPERSVSLKEIELDSGKEPEKLHAVEKEPQSCAFERVTEKPHNFPVARKPEELQNCTFGNLPEEPQNSSIESESEKSQSRAVAREPEKLQNGTRGNTFLASSFIIGSLVIFSLVCIALRRKL